MKQDELNKGKNLKSLISEYFIFVIFIIIVIGLTILKPSFITPSNLVNILKQASINGILAFGMMFVIISGGFDMSVGSTVAFSGILAAMLGQGNNPLILALIGTENLEHLILNKPVIGELLSAMVGLIPNCAASVAITTLYLDGAMSAGAMMSGLLVGAGIGLLVLFRTNRSRRENWMIAGILYAAGVAGGILTGALRLI